MEFMDFIEFTSRQCIVTNMNSEAYFASGSLIAKLVLAEGQVAPQPVDRAFEELASAVRQTQDSCPYGAVITSGDVHAGVETVWRSYLMAKDRFSRACAHVISVGAGSVGAEMVELLKGPDSPAGMCLVSSSLEADPGKSIHEYVMRWAHADVVAADDVFLLVSADDFLHKRRIAMDASTGRMRLLVHVCGGASAARMPAYAQLQAATFATGIGSSWADEVEENYGLDGATLGWRQAFIRDVRCLTAEEVAREVGHGAKNLSATASRWTSEGKIFGVRWNGKMRYPKFQFRNGEARPVVARILKALGEDPSGWDRAYFFATPSSYLDNDMPMDRINDKSMDEVLVRLAERHSHPAEVF
jgi:hypothetical protein